MICSSVSTRTFQCNMTHDLAFSMAESRPLIRESPLYPRSTNTLAKRSLDGIRGTAFSFTRSFSGLVLLVRRRIVVQAGTDALITTPPEVSPPLPVEAKSAVGSLSIPPEASAPLESATEGQNVAISAAQRSDLQADLTSNISTLVDSAKQSSTEATGMSIGM